MDKVSDIKKVNQLSKSAAPQPSRLQCLYYRPAIRKPGFRTAETFLHRPGSLARPARAASSGPPRSSAAGRTGRHRCRWHGAIPDAASW